MVDPRRKRDLHVIDGGGGEDLARQVKQLDFTFSPSLKFNVYQILSGFG